MSRNFSTLTLATLLALASTAPAQKVTWHPSQSIEPTCPAQHCPGCEGTVWDCQAQGTQSCEELHVTHGKEAAARMLMPDLMAEFLQVFNDGNLDRAELIAEFACKLQPDNKLAQRARWLVSTAKQARLPVGGTEERRCACKTSEEPRRQCVLHVNVHHPKVPELLPEPTPVEESAVPPAQRTEPVTSAEVERVIIKVPGIVAQSDRAFFLGKDKTGQPRRILLEGNVEMYLNQNNQPAKIYTGRVLLNPRDGSYELMPIQGKPMFLKPTIIVPGSPMEQGWR
jgi:hypothetical protein